MLTRAQPAMLTPARRFVVAPLWYILLAFLALVPLVIGFHDLVAAPDPPAKVLGLLLVAFALVAIAPLGFALDHSGHLHAARLWGGIGGVSLATTLLLSQYTRGEYTDYVLLWAALLTVGLLTLVGALVKLELRDLGSPKWWAAVGAVVSSTVVTGLVQFWYRTYFAPLRAHPSLVMTGALDRLPPSRPGFIPLDVHIKIKNASSIRVQALGSLYSVTGVLPTSRTLSTREFRDLIKHDVEQSITGSSAGHFVNLRRSIIQAGPLVPAGWFFAPDETYDTNLIVQVPARRHRYASVVLAVQMAYAQGERLVLTNQSISASCPGMRDETACKKLAGTDIGSAVATTWDIPRRSWLAVATSAPRYVLSAIVQRHPDQRASTPYVYALAEKQSSKPSIGPPPLNKYYSVETQWFLTELNLATMKTASKTG